LLSGDAIEEDDVRAALALLTGFLLLASAAHGGTLLGAS
jgi:hypothetical protein